METAGNEIRCISACAHDRQLQQHNPGTVLIQFSVLFCMKLSYTFETWEIKGNRKAFSKLVKKLCPFHTIFLHTFQLFLEASMRKSLDYCMNFRASLENCDSILMNDPEFYGAHVSEN